MQHTTPDTLCIVGCGGHALVVLEVVRSSGYGGALFFVDDDPAKAGTEVEGVPIAGDDAYLAAHAPCGFVVAVGDNAARRRLFTRLAARHAPLTFVHRDTTVAASAALGAGTVVMPRAAVNPRARIGEDCILNTGCVVEHECAVGAHCHIAPGAVLCGGVRVGEGTLVGAGATLLPGVSVGAGAVIGAGLVVSRDAPDHTTIHRKAR